MMFQSEYLHYAKTAPPAKFNLASSGVLPCTVEELGITMQDVELNGPSFYGYPPLQEELAARCGVSTNCVVAATGTSMGNHLVMAALLQPGDRVLLEQPVYEPLLAVAHYLRADVQRFPRRVQDGFQVDVEALRKLVSDRTRLIVLTNLHNPSSVEIPIDLLREIGNIADRCGARVLVDEVYLECKFAPKGSKDSAFHLGGPFIVTRSLTKAYGLGGLRCGWVLAPPELAQRLWRLNDLFGVVPANPAERLSVVALQKLGYLMARSSTLINTNRSLLHAFLDSHPQLESLRPPYGTTIFPRLVKGGGADAFCQLLRERYDTAVVPGKFFEMADHFRIGVGVSTDVLKSGLQRLSEAIA